MGLYSIVAHQTARLQCTRPRSSNSHFGEGHDLEGV